MELGRFRELFPVMERTTWLATPSIAPGAQPVVSALEEAIRDWMNGSVAWPEYDDLAQHTRSQFAELISPGSNRGSIALVQSVAEGASTVAASLPSGSRVVVGAGEYRSNLFPWLATQIRGVVVDQVPMPVGALPSSALIEAITEETTLVAMSTVQSATGYRTDVAAVAARCAEVGARLFLDVTQSAGVLRLPPGVDPDFLVAHGYKWLLCPRGVAWMYVREDRVSEISPLAPNHKGTARPWSQYYGGPLTLAADARKLDMSLGWPAWAGATAALGLIGALDPVQVEEHCVALAKLLRRQAEERGLTALPSELPSHIVSLRCGSNADTLGMLTAQGVRATVRGGTLRLGFHAFNTVGDVARVLSALESAA